MSSHRGKVPFVFPFRANANDEGSAKQVLEEDGRITQAVIHFPSGSAGDLRLELSAAGETIQEGSGDFWSFLWGDDTALHLDLSVAVYEGQKIGIDYENNSSEKLEGLVVYTVDFRQ